MAAMAASSLPLPPLSPSHRIPTESLHHQNPPPSNFQPSQFDIQNSGHQNQQNVTIKTPTIRSRLSQLCREGRPEIARLIFDTIPRPSTVLWNTIIIGYICNGMPDEALLFYTRMKTQSDVRCDFYTYSSVLKACAETRQLNFGKAVHCHILRSHLNPSRIVSNSLLNMYSNCLTMDKIGSSFQYDLVKKLFDTMRKRNVVAWNTMISWYVKTKRPVEAVKQVKAMMKIGVKPTVVSFINVFPAISDLKTLKIANVFYGLLVKMGSDYHGDLFAVSSAIFMYCELASIDVARKIFDYSVNRNIEIWNTLINGYVQSYFPFQGLALFVEALESDQIIVDDVTFLSALSAVSQLQRFDIGQQLHSYIIKKSTPLSTLILNAVIVMYSRCNSVGTSFEVFNKMPERDTVSWNTMISALVQNGLDDEGLMLVYEMIKQGFKIDSVTVTVLLSAASNLRNDKLGKQSHGYIFRNGIQFEGMNSYLIDMYAKSGLIKNAQVLFEKSCTHEKDEATWNAMIAGYTQNGLNEQACNVFRQMVNQNLVPNAVTLASLLPACSPMGNVSFGKQLHGFAFHHSLDQNVFVSTALIDMYSKSGSINYAENVFLNANEKNSVTYTNMILGYGQHGMGMKSLSLFHSMKENGIKPDAITLVAVLSACSYAGLVNEGLDIFNSMERDYKIQPVTEHYACVADMFGRVGRVMEAYGFIKELGVEGDYLGIWGSLFAACKLHGDFELAKVVAKKLTSMEEKEMMGYRVLLSNLYAEEGKWASVDRMRKEMRDKGFRKDVGCSWIELGGMVHCFVSRDRKHFQLENIYEMLEILAMDMKDGG